MAARSDLARWVRATKFIFAGTVRRLRAATMPVVAPIAGTIIVHVDSLIRAPAILSGFAGREITVRLSPRRNVRVGQKRAFFTNGWMYGTSLAVRAVGHCAVPGDVARLRAQIADTARRLEDRDLKARIRTASVIVAGTVAAIRPAAQLMAGLPVIRRDPFLHEALIQADSIEKGKPRQTEITAYFANSAERRWVDVPKFVAGQRGVWLLHKTRLGEVVRLRGTGTAITRREVYTAPNALDLQAPEQLDRIRRLLGRR